MSKNQYNQIYGVLVSELYKISAKEVIPVLNCSYENGYFMVNCVNQVAFFWLKKNLSKISAMRQNMNLWLRKQICNSPIIVEVFIESATEPTHVILKQLAKQNPKLCAKSFLEQKREVIKDGLLLTFVITTEMLDALMLVDKRPFYKLGRIKFKINHDMFVVGFWF